MEENITFRLSDIGRLVLAAEEYGWTDIINFLRDDLPYCVSVKKKGKYDYEFVKIKNNVVIAMQYASFPTELEALKFEAIVFSNGHRVDDYY